MGTLGIDLEIEKQEYIYGEPVWVILSIQNGTSGLLELPGPLPGTEFLEVSLNVQDNNSNTSGETLKFTEPDEDPEYAPILFLDSHKTKKFYYNLLDFFGDEISNPLVGDRYSLQNEKSYVVSLKYSYNDPATNEQTSLTTNAITFRVRDFRNHENRYFKILEEGRAELAAGRTFTAIEKFRNLSRDKSVANYKALADLYICTILSRIEDDPISYHLAFLEGNPESKFCHRVLLEVAKQLSGMERTEFMRKLFKRSKNQFLGDIVLEEFGPFK